MKSSKESVIIDLGREIETIGEFLFDSVKTFAQLDSFTRAYEINYILFHASIGIERLQKILLYLQLGAGDDYALKEKEFRTYSHEKLHNEIIENCDVKFSNAELHFLIMLSDYYREYRYSVYTLPQVRSDVRLLISQFFSIQLKLTLDLERDYLKYKNEISALFGKTLGAVVRTYYAHILTEAKKLNIPCNINPDTVAPRIFDKLVIGSDLTALIEKDTTAQKELMLYIKNSKCVNGFLELLNNIEPLELDPEIINPSLTEIYKKNYSEKLSAAVDEIYAAMDGEKLRIRKELLALIGDNARFDFFDALTEDKNPIT